MFELTIFVNTLQWCATREYIPERRAWAVTELKQIVNQLLISGPLN